MIKVEVIEMGGEKIKYVQNLLPFNYKEKDNELILGAVERKENNELAICGVLVVQMNGVSSEVIHIEVAEKFRREKIATQLLNYYIQLQFKIGAVWPITISYVDGPDHQEFVAFIENREDFDIQFDCMIYHIQADERKSSATCQKLLTLNKQAELFMTLPPYVQHRFRQKIEAKGIPYLQNVDFKTLEASLCYCIRKNEEIIAALLLERKGEQELEVVFAYADADQSLSLAVVSASAMRAVDAEYPEAVLTIVAAEAKSEAFTAHMFPYCVNKEAIFRAVWNYKT